MSAYPVAGGVAVEVVADLSQLEVGLRTAQDKAHTSAQSIASDLGKIETASKTVSTAASEIGGAIQRRMGGPAVSMLQDYERRLQSLRSAYDPVIAAQGKLNASLAEMSALRGAGVLGAEEHNRLTSLANRSYEKVRNANDNSKGLSGHQRQDLLYQSSDIVASLGSGAGLGTVAFQQAPQVLQSLASGEGGLSGGLKSLGQSAMALVTPLSVAGTAVTALGAAFAYAGLQASNDREILERSIQGLGRLTGATVSQLDLLARANAEAGKISTSTAREIAAGYASTGQIALPVFDTLISRTSEYARLTGQEIPAAASQLSTMFADPARGADMLALSIGGLDDKTRLLINTQIEHGDRTGAQLTLADSLKASIDANASATTGWAGAWITATNAANGYWEAAKRIAGIKLGLVPEGAQDVLNDLNARISNINKFRTAFGQEPIGPGHSLIGQRDAAAIIADTERRQAEYNASVELGNQLSFKAGKLAESMDPSYGRLSELRRQRVDLGDALANPFARDRLGDLSQVESSYLGVTRAIETLTDTSGKLVSQEEMAARQDRLRIDSLNAKTDAEKRSVAERQKAFDLIGKTITGSDAAARIERAGSLALLQDSARGGGRGRRSDPLDEYERALKQQDDRLRRQEMDLSLSGQGVDMIARYRTEQELLVAAKRADRDITPDLTRQIQEYGNRAAEAASRQESLRDAIRSMDQFRSGGRDVIRGMVTDLNKGASAADLFSNGLGKIKDRLLDMASSYITDSIFGKQGTTGGLFSSISGLFSLFKFADGGIMSSAGPLRLNAYASGGIASGPQLALFGEGRGPEAYVPLPDGRSIPVTMQGGAAANSNSPVTVNLIGAPPGVQVQEAQDGQGGRRIDVTFDQQMARTLTAPGSASGRALRQRTIVQR